MKFPKLTKRDYVGIAILIIVSFLLVLPSYIPKNGCEIAKADYKCATAKDTMIENCAYWGKYQCDSSKDVSLPDIEWYIGNLCKIQNNLHNTGLDCTNLKMACNQITGTTVC